MSNKSVFDPYMFLPKPRIAAHARYHSLEKSNIVNTPGKLNAVLLRGYCDSPPFYSKTSVSSYLQHELCNNVIPYNMTAYNGYYNIEMHRFDYIEWDEIFNIILLLNMNHQRYIRIQTCNHTWPIINEIFQKSVKLW